VNTIYALFLWMILSYSTAVTAALSEDFIPFVGGSATAGKSGGPGVLGGAGQLKCDTSIYACWGYIFSAGHRFRDPSTSFVEAGGAGIFLAIPAYAGLGLRVKGQKLAGGQLSIGTGILPLFLIMRAYNENSKISGEITLGFLWPLRPIGRVNR
jgi:hypothetical protein